MDEKIVLTKNADGWKIERFCGLSIDPQIFKKTNLDMIRRVMQMVDVEEAKKQNWPERVGLGMHDDNF